MLSYMGHRQVEEMYVEYVFFLSLEFNVQQVNYLVSTIRPTGGVHFDQLSLNNHTHFLLGSLQ